MGTIDFSGFYASLQPTTPKGGGESMARCPFHKDKVRSLSVNLETGVWFCHAGCGGGGAREFARRMGWQFPETVERAHEVYPYQDEQGQTLYEVVRFWPKEFRQRQNKDVWNLKGVRRVPYRLPDLLKTDEVFFVEGEKDVHTLVSHGFKATCVCGGAKGWRAEYALYFKGKKVWIISDNDPPGRELAQQVFEALEKIAKPRIIELPVKEHGDVSDWFAESHTADELKKIVAEFAQITVETHNRSALAISKDLFRKLEYSYEHRHGPSGVITGIKTLDDLTWGFQPQQVYVVGGRTSMGKSGALISMARGAAERSFRVLYIALESSAVAIQRRILSHVTGISVESLMHGTIEDWPTVTSSLAKIAALPLHINDRSNLTAQQVIEDCEAGTWDIVFVDHLQEVRGTSTSRHLDLSDAVGTFHAYAEKADIPVVIASQLRRRYEGSPQPRLSDLKESGDIEQRADVVMLLYRPFVDDPQREDPTLMDLVVAKNRDGRTAKVRLNWNAELTLIGDRL